MSSLSSWSATLPELDGITPAAMDPTRIEEAMREGYATGHAAGREDGYAAGFLEGRNAGLAALNQDRRNLAAAAATLADQLSRLEAAEAEIRASFAAATVDAAIAIAEAVLGRELAVAENPGVEAIRRAFAVAPTDAASATVRLHPNDADRLVNASGLVPGVELLVVPDPAIEPGGCQLVVGDTSVDASIGAALERVREALR